MKIFHLLLFLLTSPLTLFAQDVEMANALRQSGKIYVVVAVIAVIFVGLAVYLFSIDKKIGKIERQLRNK